MWFGTHAGQKLVYVMGIVKTVLEKITEIRLQITAQKDTEKPQIYECQVSKW
jgi:hypothetical protein